MNTIKSFDWEMYTRLKSEAWWEPIEWYEEYLPYLEAGLLHRLNAEYVIIKDEISWETLCSLHTSVAEAIIKERGYYEFQDNLLKETKNSLLDFIEKNYPDMRVSRIDVSIKDIRIYFTHSLLHFLDEGYSFYNIQEKDLTEVVSIVQKLQPLLNLKLGLARDMQAKIAEYKEGTFEL